MTLANVVFIGSDTFGRTSLERIADEGYEVSGIITEVDDVCGVYAKDHEIPAIRLAEKHRKLTGSLKDKVIGFIDRRKPDFLVMCVWEKQMPKEIVDKYKNKFINFHASPLPLYRGWGPINWQIIHGRKRIGMSVSFVTQQYDRGPIIQRYWAPISDLMNSSDVYDFLEPFAAEMLCKTLGKLTNGKKIKLIHQPQRRIEPEAPEFNDANTCIDWNNTAIQIRNLIRGCNPMHYAHTNFGDEKVLIDFALAVNYAKKRNPGEITEVYKDAFKITCGRGELLVTDILHEDESSYSISDFVKKHGF